MATPIIPSTPLHKVLGEFSLDSPTIRPPVFNRHCTPPPLPEACERNGITASGLRNLRCQRLPGYMKRELFTCSSFVYSRKNVESMKLAEKGRKGPVWLSKRKFLVLSEEESMYERLKKQFKRQKVTYGRRLKRSLRLPTKKRAPQTPHKSPLRRNTVAPIPTTPWDEGEMDRWAFLPDLDRPNSALRNDTEPYLAAQREIEQLLADMEARLQEPTTPRAAMHESVYVRDLWRPRRIIQRLGDPMDLDDQTPTRQFRSFPQTP